MIFISSVANAQVSFGNPYATNVTSTSATLNGTVNLNNTYQISYQIATSEAAINSGANQESSNKFAGFYNLSYNRLNLLPETTYYFRFRALAFGVYTNSVIGSFTTPSNKPEVFYSPPSNITSNDATINYTINAKGSNTTSIVRYGLSNNATTSSITGFSATGTTNTAGNTVLTGLTPNTDYYYLIEATNMNGTSTTTIGTFTTTSLIPIISNISTSVITTTTATINYTLNANGNNTTSLVYILDGGIITVSETGFPAVGNTNTSGNVIFTGLTPGTTYTYQIEATNSNGTSYSSILNFTTNPAESKIAEYSFDNTYNNLLGSVPFASNSGTSFTTDRHGNTSGAININSTGSTATITGLPYGNAPRTVSVWVKVNAYNSAFPFHNTIFSYGAFSNSNAFGFSITDGFTMVLGYNNNYTALSTNNLATWDHYVCAYDGTNAKVYKNGILLGSQAIVWNTINNSDEFRIGIGVGGEFWFNGAIDDLKIYNYVLTDTEISNLHANNTLSSSDYSQKNLEVALYPNPVDDILNIETVLELQSVEIYNIQGQKVKTSNQKQLNVSDLATGLYLVKIQDFENNSAIKKIVIK